MKLPILLVGLAALALGGCASNGATGHRDALSGTPSAASRTPPLVGVGPGTSAESRVQLLLKSGVPGLVPDEVEDYMDRQEATLRDELAGTGVTIDRLGQQIRLTLPGDITFNSGTSDIRSDFFSVLNSVSKVLTTFDQTVVDIAVHTDSIGERTNLPLSERRADSVASYLRTQKVDPRRMASFGMGSKQPVASNDYVAGRERNRRVEIILTPIVAPRDRDRAAD